MKERMRNAGGFPLVATAALGILAAWISYLGVRDDWDSSTPIVRDVVATDIVLPYEEVHIPDGPNRDVFQTACVICHSPRLIFGQPTISAAKWTEVVHKMTATYGAPICAEDERRIVAYLVSIQADRSDR